MKICILGATGLVGHELMQLVQRAWPQAELKLFASREQTLNIDGHIYQVKAAEELERPDASRGELAFVALDDAYSARYVPRLLDLGYRVVDKSNTYRLQPSVPLVVAGVNDGLVDSNVSLVANPNCTTIPLLLALAPLHRKWGLQTMTVASYQAISGAGMATLDDFLEQSRQGYAKKDRLGRQFSASEYVANTVPHNGKTDESGYSSEERKVCQESQKILDIKELPVSAQCCRVAVAVGHYEQVWFQLGKCNEGELSLAAVEALLQDTQKAPFVHLIAGSEGDGLSALACLEHRDHALVGRLRLDPRDPERRSFCLTVVADNLRLGAATNAVRIASRWFPSLDLELQGPGAQL